MSRRAGGGFTQWADSLLAGTGWTLATVRGAAAAAGGGDLAAAALADGFAAAAKGLARAGDGVDGAA
ncbi:MAG: chemotaxis protein [Mycolicibacterium sp.]|uniref:chemotaxis protein n=1 Tax=Mycolicibacterium sp. TaxID=2320850 RepID=UPI000F9DE18D|nr:chemotaxis protein [Mycolicibacterium sp.]RUP26141.1 MAG: chemotaxis protein [Mycolicibacterium sp.]